jgi:glycosyltransferase involved in cell wall biosynthesis
VPALSVTIITRNEAENLPAALESAAWADEILVVDCGSTDATVAIAREHGARVIHRDWRGYSEQKNFAASRASHDWIFSLDADERITPALADEVRSTLSREPPHAGYRMPRVSWYLGAWIRTTDWYPDRQLRLYDRRRGRWANRRVHESIVLEGPEGALHHTLEHHPYRDISHHLQTMDRYTTLAAEDMLEQGRRVGLGGLLLHPPAAFLRNYVLRQGVRQGTAGLIISVLNAYYVFLKFAKAWQMSSGPGSHVSNPGPVRVGPESEVGPGVAGRSRRES